MQSNQVKNNKKSKLEHGDPAQLAIELKAANQQIKDMQAMLRVMQLKIDTVEARMQKLQLRNQELERQVETNQRSQKLITRYTQVRVSDNQTIQ